MLKLVGCKVATLASDPEVHHQLSVASDSQNLTVGAANAIPTPMDTAAPMQPAMVKVLVPSSVNAAASREAG